MNHANDGNFDALGLGDGDKSDADEKSGGDEELDSLHSTERSFAFDGETPIFA